MSYTLNEEVASFNTGVMEGTFVIGASFIFIAYFLHPAVESAYQRVRAYRAWRAIEKRQAVEVTNYPMLTETLGGRGKWDTARVITVLLAVFSLISWGLELSMDLANHKGDADILNRSPPILVEETSDGTNTWKVNWIMCAFARLNRSGPERLYMEETCVLYISSSRGLACCVSP